MSTARLGHVHVVRTLSSTHAQRIATLARKFVFHEFLDDVHETYSEMTATTSSSWSTPSV